MYSPAKVQESPVTQDLEALARLDAKRLISDCEAKSVGYGTVLAGRLEGDPLTIIAQAAVMLGQTGQYDSLICRVAEAVAEFTGEAKSAWVGCTITFHNKADHLSDTIGDGQSRQILAYTEDGGVHDTGIQGRHRHLTMGGGGYRVDDMAAFTEGLNGKRHILIEIESKKARDDVHIDPEMAGHAVMPIVQNLLQNPEALKTFIQAVSEGNATLPQLSAMGALPAPIMEALATLTQNGVIPAVMMDALVSMQQSLGFEAPAIETAVSNLGENVVPITPNTILQPQASVLDVPQVPSVVESEAPVPLNDNQSLEAPAITAKEAPQLRTEIPSQASPLDTVVELPKPRSISAVLNAFALNPLAPPAPMRADMPLQQRGPEKPIVTDAANKQTPAIVTPKAEAPITPIASRFEAAAPSVAQLRGSWAAPVALDARNISLTVTPAPTQLAVQPMMRLAETPVRNAPVADTPARQVESPRSPNATVETPKTQEIKVEGPKPMRQEQRVEQPKQEGPQQPAQQTVQPGQPPQQASTIDAQQPQTVQPQTQNTVQTQAPQMPAEAVKPAQIVVEQPRNDSVQKIETAVVQPVQQTSTAVAQNNSTVTTVTGQDNQVTTTPKTDVPKVEETRVADPAVKANTAPPQNPSQPQAPKVEDKIEAPKPRERDVIETGPDKRAERLQQTAAEEKTKTPRENDQGPKQPKNPLTDPDRGPWTEIKPNQPPKPSDQQKPDLPEVRKCCPIMCPPGVACQRFNSIAGNLPERTPEQQEAFIAARAAARAAGQPLPRAA